jgi:hypothetical protein
LAGHVELLLGFGSWSADYQRVGACVIGREAHDVVIIEGLLRGNKIDIARCMDSDIVHGDARFEMHCAAGELEATVSAAGLWRAIAADQLRTQDENAGARSNAVRRRIDAKQLHVLKLAPSTRPHICGHGLDLIVR